ncbi:histone-like nucleoid-structuring protein Lsr2 [Micromonospora chalcea]
MTAREGHATTTRERSVNDETTETETSTAVEAATPKEVRAWALAQGRTDVGARGRISATVKHAFTAATGRPVA